MAMARAWTGVMHAGTAAASLRLWLMPAPASSECLIGPPDHECLSVVLLLMQSLSVNLHKGGLMTQLALCKRPGLPCFRGSVPFSGPSCLKIKHILVGVIGIEWRVVDCRTHVPADGSGSSQDPAPLKRSSVPLPSVQELDRAPMFETYLQPSKSGEGACSCTHFCCLSMLKGQQICPCHCHNRLFDHRPFATSVGSGTNLATAQSTSVAGLQQNAQEMVADKLQRAQERWGGDRKLLFLDLPVIRFSITTKIRHG
eukprot:scaffold75775_cov19-Tisochrysis_lutea.AAC.1